MFRTKSLTVTNHTELKHRHLRFSIKKHIRFMILGILPITRGRERMGPDQFTEKATHQKFSSVLNKLQKKGLDKKPKLHDMVEYSTTAT